jgi:hypothetical protein
VRTETESLRKCPLCLTPIGKLDLGVRDHRWVRLPGKVGAADIDFIVNQYATRRMCIIEWKPVKVKSLSTGQKLTLAMFAEVGWDVFLGIDGELKEKGVVYLARVDKDGNVGTYSPLKTLEQLNEFLNRWWDRGFEKKEAG